MTGIKKVSVSNEVKGGEISQEFSSLLYAHSWCESYRCAPKRSAIEWDRAFVSVYLEDGRVYETQVFLDGDRPLTTLAQLEESLSGFINEKENYDH